MKKIISVALALALAGCAGAGPNQTGGAVIGATAGGLLGSMIGGGSGRIAGAAAGAAIGGLAGSAVGANMDQQQRYSAPTQGSTSSGEASAYNRGRMEYEAEQQRMREAEAYRRGRQGL